MKKLLKILVTVFACVTACFCAACRVPELPTVSAAAMTSFIDRLIADTPSYIPAWNREGFKGKWHYIDGVFLNSVLQLYKETENEKYSDFFINYINYYIAEDGNFIKYEKQKDGSYKIITTGNAGFNSDELDTVCGSRVLFDAYDMTGDDRYLTAIDYTYNRLMEMPRAAGTQNFAHKKGYRNQVWLDGMYMYAPFLARYAKENNNSELFDTIAAQYRFIYENMRDGVTGLYYHGIYTGDKFGDETYWATSDKRTSKSFWLRAEGWLLTSLADVIEYFPDGGNKQFLTAMFSDAVSDIYKFRDSKTGMFYQLIEKGEFKTYVSATYFNAVGNKAYNGHGAEVSNYVEASGSSMLAYAMMKGSDYLGSDYYGKGKKLFEAVYTHSFSQGSNELRDICITAGLGDTYKEDAEKTNKFYWRDGSPEYYLAEPVGSNDAKGVGPFIMAYLQYSN